ncbi:hypothetical protein CAOG_000929 [Capsaspora owczarzaki ATCC 30864]|uniref:LIM zinc-binding domain-containing protein n=1 Tax=Capsaspora owczarzaki (strain ATCC 30864) TaxID=595528 RepID=A0A0D2WI45_CAPO3|nr:hypothetical protein CAOG_000929 [Capsaspora owczarzaki ATCC 30864]
MLATVREGRELSQWQDIPQCMPGLLGNMMDHEGQLYCLDDYNTLFGKKCGTCGEFLLGEFTSVGETYYHLTCMKCAGCKKPIEHGDSFGDCADGFVCDTCCDRVCPQCDRPTHDNDAFLCEGEVSGWYHKHCLRCASCDKTLTAQSYRPYNGNPYCEEHFKLVSKTTVNLSSTCAACNKRIDSSGIRALDKQWHVACFACAECKEVINGGFIEHNGKLYCSNDYEKKYAPKCFACSQALVGSFMEVDGQKFHPNCIVCVACHKGFGSGQNIRFRGKSPYHMDCLTCVQCRKPFAVGAAMYSVNGQLLCGNCSN